MIESHDFIPTQISTFTVSVTVQNVLMHTAPINMWVVCICTAVRGTLTESSSHPLLSVVNCEYSTVTVYDTPATMHTVPTTW